MKLVFWPPYIYTHIDMHLHVNEHIHIYKQLNSFFLVKKILIQSFTQQIGVIRDCG